MKSPKRPPLIMSGRVTLSNIPADPGSIEKSIPINVVVVIGAAFTGPVSAADISRGRMQVLHR